MNNQKHQKIKLHGTLTTKELKKQSTRTTRPIRTHGEAGLTEQETETQRWLWTMVGVAMVGETPSHTQEYQNSLESGARAKQASCIAPSLALPPQIVPQCSSARRVALPWWIPKAPPPYNLTGVPRQRNIDQMKEQSKTSERELSNEEIATYLMENLKPW